MAGYSEAQKRATKKYNDRMYDDIKIRVPKGDRERFKAHAEAKGISLNQLIVNLVREDMESK